MFTVLVLAHPASGQRDNAAFHLVTACFIAPFILFAPLNGALSNCLPKRRVLVGSSLFCLLVALLFGGLGWPWLVGIALTGVGTAIYSPARYALLPAAAQDTGIPLTRVTGWIEMGGAAGIVAGMFLALTLHDKTWQGWPAPVAIAIAAGVVSLLAALPVGFASDVRRPESPAAAMAGFFRDTGRVLREPDARGSLLGVAAVLALVTAGAGAVLNYLSEANPDEAPSALSHAMVLILVGAATGALLAGVPWHPRRALALVPLGAAGMLAVLLWGTLGSELDLPCLLMGVMSGLVSVPLRAEYQDAVPADARGNGMAVLNTANHVASVGLALLLVGLERLGLVDTGARQLLVLAGLAAVGTVIAWRVFFRDVLELLVSLLVAPMYRIRRHGPGLASFPRRGPLLVISNHTAYFDPIWLAKALPRRLTPMMTSVFYDLPVLRWLMTRVVRAIRVEASNFRREAPELAEAVKALDRGECVLLFPEAWVKRKPGVTLRQFGQGVWHILRQRPQTPVVLCWIEGSWGSFSSYYGGRPMVNKRLDWFWPIDVAVREPEVLPAELLADQRATRNYLMQRCLETGRYLGLEPVTSTEPQEENEDRVKR
jgi:1-acyl-sn-glycerol-3-phosphate acyltransferase